MPFSLKISRAQVGQVMLISVMVSPIKSIPANKILDQIDEIVPRANKYFVIGNHEMWVYGWIAESPEARHELADLNFHLGFKKRKYKIIPFNKFMSLGKLKITHGLYTGMHHAKKHVDMMGKSILYGHLHDIQTYSKVSRRRRL